MDNIKIDRKTITIDILKEVNSLPFEYLKTLYSLRKKGKFQLG